MRSVFALASAAWLIGAAILVGDGRLGTAGEPPNEQIIGDAAVMAIHAMARILFVGIALLALCAVEWQRAWVWLGVAASRDAALAADETAAP